MKVLGIDHVGIVVADIEQAVAHYEKALRAKPGKVFEGGPGEMRGCYIALGEASVELVQPLKKDNRPGKFVAERGYGLYHLALRVENLDEAVAELRRLGIDFFEPQPFATATGDRTIFAHPEGFGGTIIQLVGK